MKGVKKSFLACLFLLSLQVHGQPCIADFSYTLNGMSVTFQDRSTGNAVIFQWNFGDGTTGSGRNVTHTYTVRRKYTVRLSISNPNNPQCSDFRDTTICVGCVFPGDANNDGIVNNKDVLYVGLAFGAIGPVRADTSGTPDFTPSPPWVSVLGLANHPGGINYNHSDCDGNGIVNRHDVRIIDKNYGLQPTPKSGGNGCLNTQDVPLYFEVIDSIPAGSAVTIALRLGNLQVPAHDAYGIAFTIVYNAELVRGEYTDIDYSASLLGPPQEIIYLNKNFPLNGRIESAVSRIDHNGLTLAGKIGTLNFVMEENLAQKTLITKTLNLAFDNVFLIRSDGSAIPVCAHQDSAVVFQKLLTSGQAAEAIGKILLYPNPAREWLTIECPQHRCASLQLVNIWGQKVAELRQVSESRISLPLEGIPEGLYFMIIQDSNGVQIFKIEIAR
ncbi:MAG: hypothetical protein KatS3mg031_0967 [Chitinophagales bacterium]|nr:MAG: hypothetical protein KatS3mg031_0967 [Chitinophagales bacterium]